MFGVAAVLRVHRRESPAVSILGRQHIPLASTAPDWCSTHMLRSGSKCHVCPMASLKWGQSPPLTPCVRETLWDLAMGTTSGFTLVAESISNLRTQVPRFVFPL